MRLSGIRSLYPLISECFRLCWISLCALNITLVDNECNLGSISKMLYGPLVKCGSSISSSNKGTSTISHGFCDGHKEGEKILELVHRMSTTVVTHSLANQQPLQRRSKEDSSTKGLFYNFYVNGTRRRGRSWRSEKEWETWHGSTNSL